MAQLVASHTTLFEKETFWTLDPQGNKMFHEMTFTKLEDEEDHEKELTLVFLQDVTAQMKESAF